MGQSCRYFCSTRQPDMIRAILVLALVATCLAQQASPQQQIAKTDGDQGKLFFGAFGTRTSIYMTTSTITRYTTCTTDDGSTDACAGRRRRRRRTAKISEKLEDTIDSSLAGGLDRSDVVDKEGKLGFYRTVTTTVSVTTTSFNGDITVTLRRECAANPTAPYPTPSNVFPTC